MRRVGILSGGGDCPGINAVVRAVCKSLIHDHRVEMVGVRDGFRGLVLGQTRVLRWDDVSGILLQGGTILGASNRDNPYAFLEGRRGHTTTRDRSRDVLRNFKTLGLDALVVIGGDGTMRIAECLVREHHLPLVGVPKTIDNDVRGTDLTFGFFSAVATAAEAIERLRTTAQSHHRIMVVEVMGRDAGWLALYAGMASGADIVLIPEIPYRLADLRREVADRQKHRRSYTMVVVAEGAKPQGGARVVRRRVADGTVPERLGGIGDVLALELEQATGSEARSMCLGHIQRGGPPVAFDRILATRFGAAAAGAVVAGRRGVMVALERDRIVARPLRVAAGGPRLVPLDDEMLRIARSLGTHLGVALPA